MSDEEYLHAVKIWNDVNMKNMSDYHNYYLKKDVLLLADIFEKFISRSLEIYKLDPSHYYSSPGVNLNAMLKIRQVKLKLISDIGMHLFIERRMIDEIS